MRRARGSSDGRELQRRDDPFAPVRAITSFGAPSVVGRRPPGLGFHGGWVGALGYDLARHVGRLPQVAATGPALPQQWWMAVDQVLAHHHPSGRWWHVTVRGPVSGAAAACRPPR